MDASQLLLGNRSKVLIIEDEIDLCLLMRVYYVRKNYEVFIAHTAQDGIQKAAAQQPNYIIASYNLPDDTYRLEQRLREVAPHAEIQCR